MILHIGRVILILLEVLILFNLLIVVHELGHFLAARWRGLYIEKFGIWFGKPIWKKTMNGVQYSLGSLPFGGFVALPQLAPMDIIEGKADMDRSKLPPISAIDKIIVAVAGPFFSLMLAFAFACLVWTFGYPVSESDMTTTVGYIEKDSPAGKAGMHPGDKILEVDGKPVHRFSGMNDSVTWSVLRSEGESIPFKVERDGKILDFNVVPYKAEKRGWRRKSVRQVLIYPAVSAVVQNVLPDSPAAAAGLQPGDVIRAFNDTPIYNPLALTDYIEAHPNEPVRLRISRGGKEIEATVTPKLMAKQQKTLIGVQWDLSGHLALAHPSPLEQIDNSISSTLNTISAIISPKSDVKLQHLSGPVGIVRIYYLLFDNEHGWQLALWFSVILNVNLAIINLLPIPVLDGGHVVLGIIESVRRKPLNTRVLEIVQGTCTAVIIVVILYTTFFDLQDLPFIKKKLDRFEPQSQSKDADAP
ncbi:MAG: regulator of sigma protease [Verrucomicrobiota bacterium]|jgi:regulator of sigma E protease